MAAMQETSRINDSKEGLAEKEDIEPSSTKLRQEDHDAPLTEDDIAFVENFAQSPEKSRLMRKIDLRILPILILLYLISFIDRSNIGNARIEGLEVDLRLSPQQYSWCLTIFFFFYVACEMPSNILLKILRPTRWIPLIMVAWGVVMTLQGIVQNYAGLLLTRAFLGVTEAGFFPAAIYILSNWYLKQELGQRVAWLYASAGLAGSFSGLLAFAIAKMRGIAGLNGWRWIFIIEGIVTVCIAPFTPFLLTDDILRAKWLKEDEKRYLTKRIKVDRMGTDKGPFQWRYARQAFGDWKVWAHGFTFFAGGCTTYGMSFALPTIIKQLGYTSAVAQLMTVPVYFAAASLTLIIAMISDRTRRRVRYIIIPYSLALLGLVFCIVTPRPRLPGLTLCGVYFIAMGNYSSVPAVISFLANNQSGEWKRGVAVGIHIACGSAGGILGSNIFFSHEAPRYYTGYGICIAVNVLAQLVAIFLYFYLRAVNKKRDAMSEQEIYAKYTPEQLADMGNDSPLFRYET